MARLNAIGQNSLFGDDLFMIAQCNCKGQLSLLNYKSAYFKELETTVWSRDKAVQRSMGAPNTGSSRSSASFSTSATTAATRLKREDHKSTKNDPDPYEWKILIGPSDWENYRLGKEGAERYRTQNLPNESCPGIYKLAIIIKLSNTKARKLGSSSVCVVYVGQSDNVRTRLQQYGRDGAHLEKGCSRRGPGLFSKTFSRGHGIAYRWVSMNSKKDAELAEEQLLDKFDYAWNKDGNGSRREDDIWKLLVRRGKKSLFSRAKNLFSNKKKKEGTKNNFIFSKKLGIKRVQPPVPDSDNDECADICGVAIGHGSICTTPPVKGRKRCLEHKGMRVNGCISPSKGNGVVASQCHVVIPNERLNHARENSGDKNSAPICGVILEDGTSCKSKPFQRNKRCLQHKGKRVLRPESNFVTVKL